MGNFNRNDRSGSRGGFGNRGFGGDRGRGGRGGFGGGDRTMYKAVCAKCGKDCEVPFEPRDGRPVFCSDCFEKTEGASTSSSRGFQDSRGSRDSRDFQDRGPRRPDFERSEAPRPRIKEDIDAINTKLDKILEMLAATVTEEEEIVPTKVKVYKKRTPKVKK
ncbi:hypothetical protein A2415_04935 [candidate division WWE3 bacterium RIFOXYC1_FULL_39_7]|uniref:CxxC-x17-CxxC domain-containing protein n=2 Tax=Katanobacteria TaxID=422282 RepID=A0A1F4X6W5_UNCKA|nr:MAG: hypothetical protein A2415_04935 [candidate division WWE3 bacterium RIFOXYC1_FULL_39_7]OGC77406.1 MAG: hypothetical protein A2619_03265 [candidate division WWE3 bacterium RIFOXYD1_FULL_39_9]